MKLSIAEIIEATQAELLQGSIDEIVHSISTDSRSIQKGDFFLCLIGENFDAHHYIHEVLAKGAAGIILQKDRVSAKDLEELKVPTLAVKDTLYAFGNIARAWRRKFSIPLVGIGGSNGKTSTKDMAAAVLSSQYKTLSTEGNLNNLIGVPKMLLKLEEGIEAAVIEMGMNDFGEMARLTEIAEPTVGLLTNTGFEHVEKMKNLEGVAKSNGEMFEKMPSGALALINADDAYIPQMPTRAYKISFGIEKAADILCLHHEANEKGIHLELSFRTKKYSFDLPVQGMANVKNALAALSVGFALGLDPVKMKKTLAAYQGRAMRMEWIELKKDLRILNDCYNANPSSMMAALEIVASSKKDQAALAILGEMRELGDFAEEGHRIVGEAVAKNGIHKLISVGPFSKQMVEAAITAGMPAESCFATSSQEEAQEKILSWVPESRIVLVKGSRGAKMEKVTELIKEKF